jgi:hypothetical protein
MRQEPLRQPQRIQLSLCPTRLLLVVVLLP